MNYRYNGICKPFEQISFPSEAESMFAFVQAWQENIFVVVEITSLII